MLRLNDSYPAYLDSDDPLVFWNSISEEILMPGMLTRFRIEALHNRYTIDVPIRDNRLILVGENGTGKSTVANFIYFFLTGQWHRMLDYKFERVLAIVDSETIEFTREDLSKGNKADQYLKRFVLTAKIKSRILDIIATKSPQELLHNTDELSRYAREAGVPVGMFIELIELLSEEPVSKKFEDTLKRLKDLIADRILYLPTYRRIEQDLTAIFPELASSSMTRTSPEVRYLIEGVRHRIQGPNYIELVQFGMQDVEETIKKKMDELGKNWRDDLSKLTGTYLRDVIQGAYQSAAPAEIEKLDEATIDAIFNRTDQSVLPKPEQERLRLMVAKIRAEHIIQDEDRVVAHFLTRLIELHKNQQENEKAVREFVAVCNRYLSGKEVYYDNMSFTIQIRLKQHDTITLGKHEDDMEDALPMNTLSSGEKQIVSLFSQIYLSAYSRYFVIIDEPELSLSVPWQKRFLPDILASGRCSGLIAVTHSPFICDNELDVYMHGLEHLYGADE